MHRTSDTSILSTYCPRGFVMLRWWDKLAPQRTLFESSAFRVTGIIFFGCGLIYATSNFLNYPRAYPEPLSPEFFAFLYNVLKTPVLVAGISLPILGLIASHLRSLQTKEQIESQQEQNIFSNHLEHRKHFREFYESHQPFGESSKFSVWDIYDSVFTSSQNGVFFADEEVLNLFNEISKSVGEILEHSRTNERQAQPDILLGLIVIHSEARRLFGIFTRPEVDADEQPITYLEQCLTNLQTLTEGAAACVNFHRTQIDGNNLATLYNGISLARRKLGYRGRCERIHGLLLELIREDFSTDTTADKRKIVEEALKNEAKYLNFESDDPDPGVEVLENEVRAVIEGRVPKEEQERAIEIMPMILRMLLSKE